MNYVQRFGIGYLAASAALLAGGALPRSVAAATIVVTTLEDVVDPADRLCSLREAIDTANTNASHEDCSVSGSLGADTITFDAGLAGGTIELVDTGPVIADPAGLTLDALLMNVTISGRKMWRVMEVLEGAALTLESITIAHGSHDNFAGGILNSGSLSLSRSVVTQNRAIGRCGAIVNDGHLVVSQSTFSGNFSTEVGGVCNGGTMVVTQSTFSGNRGWTGAIDNGGILTITHSTFFDNGVDLEDVVFRGGAIKNGLEGVLTVIHSTFAGNHAHEGGGIWNESITPMTIRNSLFVNNSGGSCFNEGHGTVFDQGYNLEDSTKCGFTAPTSLSNTDPLLGPLQDNGGPTQTMAPQSGSLAIDAIPNAPVGTGCGSAYTVDQRGDRRPQPFPNGNCDIGALESTEPALFKYFKVRQLVFRRRASTFFLQSEFALDRDHQIDPLQDLVTLKVGNTVVTIPPHSFKKRRSGAYVFAGSVSGIRLEVTIWPSRDGKKFDFRAVASCAHLSGIGKSVSVELTIGDDKGAAQVAVNDNDHDHEED